MLGFDEEKADQGGLSHIETQNCIALPCITIIDTNSVGDGNAVGDEEDGLQPLDQQLLRKYVSYARASVKPVLHDVDSEKIAALYADLRAQSAISGGWRVSN